MKCNIAGREVKHLTDRMFGLFFEDINYGADGGLYAEMLENRQFAFRKAYMGEAERTYGADWVPEYGWSVYKDVSCASMTMKEGNSLCEKNPFYMNFTVNEGKAGFTNKAYDGIFLKKGEAYQVTLWVRCEKDVVINVRVLDAEGNALTKGGAIVACAAWKEGAQNGFVKYETTLVAEDNLKNGAFVVEQETGSADYGYVSMIPADAVAGVFRKDLFDMLQEMKPGFLRFPGGCIVEGANLANRYQWKETVGESWNRAWNWSRWAVHDITMGQGEPTFYPFYNQSYGIGFYEYFLLCELLDCKPLPVLGVALACQFQSDELVPIDDPEFQAYLQDALDLIEFANGDVTTPYGALRARMGHPAPFGLEYIGIGNEQWETEKVDFFARYTAFEKAIHAVHPEIELLGSAGPDVNTPRYEAAWNFYHENARENSRFTAAVDEHYYMPPKWFYENLHMYDDYSREIPVFAGEYAAHGEGKKNNVEAALAEAAFMCGLERNGDVIRFASAAPLFARKDYWQWIPDYIWFDGETVSGTPGYYVQKLFSRYTGDATVDFELEGAPENVYGAVSRREDTYFVKLINTGEAEATVESIILEGQVLDISKAQVLCMQGASLSQCNVLGQGDDVVLEEKKEDVNILPAYSCSVFVFHK